MFEGLDNYATVFFLLLLSHALCDFALQNEYISVHKSRKGGEGHWGWVLGAHALIHGGGVYYATGGILLLGILETIAHGLIDYRKCQGQLTYSQDQLLHIVCKIAWLIVVIIQYK